MEKIFTPSKWFVLFCAVLVIIFGALQMVASMRLQELAKSEGAKIFSWNWKGSAHSLGLVDNAEILKKTETDATVRVRGTERIEVETVPSSPSIHACSALLTFYRVNKEWMLGKVEFE